MRCLFHQEVGLDEVSHLVRQESTQSSTHLRSVLGEFVDGCGRYLRLVDSLRTGIGCGKTRLDKYRIEMCKTTVVSIHDTRS